MPADDYYVLTGGSGRRRRPSDVTGPSRRVSSHRDSGGRPGRWDPPRQSQREPTGPHDDATKEVQLHGPWSLRDLRRGRGLLRAGGRVTDVVLMGTTLVGDDRERRSYHPRSRRLSVRETLTLTPFRPSSVHQESVGGRGDPLRPKVGSPRPSDEDLCINGVRTRKLRKELKGDVKQWGKSCQNCLFPDLFL